LSRLGALPLNSRPRVKIFRAMGAASPARSYELQYANVAEECKFTFIQLVRRRDRTSGCKCLMYGYHPSELVHGAAQAITSKQSQNASSVEPAADRRIRRKS
jgi:hypothetical protein